MLSHFWFNWIKNIIIIMITGTFVSICSNIVHNKIIQSPYTELKNALPENVKDIDIPTIDPMHPQQSKKIQTQPNTTK